VRAHEIAEVVNAEADLMEVCKKLIGLANEAGGPDNITVVAARFEGDGLVVRDAETVQHRVYRGSDSRPTMPIERASIPQSGAIDPTGDRPTAEITSAQIRANLPPTPPPGGWIPASTLRLFFGFLGALVAFVLLFQWLRR
jgi:hypothetical protein